MAGQPQLMNSCGISTQLQQILSACCPPAPTAGTRPGGHPTQPASTPDQRHTSMPQPVRWARTRGPPLLQKIRRQRNPGLPAAPPAPQTPTASTSLLAPLLGCLLVELRRPHDGLARLLLDLLVGAPEVQLQRREHMWVDRSNRLGGQRPPPRSVTPPANKPSPVQVAVVMADPARHAASRPLPSGSCHVPGQPATPLPTSFTPIFLKLSHALVSLGSTQPSSARARGGGGGGGRGGRGGGGGGGPRRCALASEEQRAAGQAYCLSAHQELAAAGAGMPRQAGPPTRHPCHHEHVAGHRQRTRGRWRSPPPPTPHTHAPLAHLRMGCVGQTARPDRIC